MSHILENLIKLLKWLRIDCVGNILIIITWYMTLRDNILDLKIGTKVVYLDL